MYLLFLIAVVFALFFNTTIPTWLGYENLIHTLAALPMLIYFTLNLITKKIRYCKDAVYVILLAVIIFAFKLSIGQNYFHQVSLLLIIPMMTSMCFDNLTKKELTLLRRITIFFFIALCSLSIVEWTLNYNFFIIPEDNEFWMRLGFFRSTSLLGHPLQNAQVVAIFMAFIAVSDFKKKYIQIILFFLGYVSLFCFDARGAILVVTITTVPYFIWKMNRITKQKKKWMTAVGIFCIFFSMLYMVMETPMGGRLMSIGILDADSGQTRFDVFNFYQYYNHDFLWGGANNYDYIKGKLHTGAIENGVIAMSMYYGIVLTIPMLLLLFRFQYRKLSMYSQYDKWLLLAVYYILANSNPNLMLPVQWTLWIFTYYTFRSDLLRPHDRNT